MGKRTENGFLVKTQNGDEVLISNHEARSIYDTLEHEYHLEDVRNELEERGMHFTSYSVSVMIKAPCFRQNLFFQAVRCFLVQDTLCDRT